MHEIRNIEIAVNDSISRVLMSLGIRLSTGSCTARTHGNRRELRWKLSFVRDEDVDRFITAYRDLLKPNFMIEIDGDVVEFSISYERYTGINYDYYLEKVKRQLEKDHEFIERYRQVYETDLTYTKKKDFEVMTANFFTEGVIWSYWRGSWLLEE